MSNKFRGVVEAGGFSGPVTGDITGNVTGNLTGNSAGTHTGAVVGNVTGNTSGSSGSCTGNAATATNALACSGNAATATLAAQATKLAAAGRAVLNPVTATGSSQTVAHGLASTPGVLVPIFAGGHDGAGGSGDKFPSITGMSVDATNVTFTLTAGAAIGFYVAL